MSTLEKTLFSKFKIGDVVKIKGQSDIILTIYNINIDINCIIVVWFNKNHQLEEFFAKPEMLELVNN